MRTSSALAAVLVTVPIASSGQSVSCNGAALGLTPTDTCRPGIYDCEYCPDPEEASQLTTCAPYSSDNEDPKGNVMVVGASAIVAMLMAFGIGGNDSANSWGTSVGSGAISLRKACLLGGFAEFLGATLLGAGVSGTIQKGVASITSEECWACGYCDSKMALYQFGMVAALCSAMIFLFLVTFWAMPVSTTHAIVGGVVGMTATAIGGSCLNFGMTGLGGIALSWVASPIFAGIVGSMMYVATHEAVFRAQDPVKAALLAVPVLYGLTSSSMLFLILKKAPFFKRLMGQHDEFRGLIALAILVAVPILIQVFVMPGVRRDVNAYREQLQAEKHTTNDAETPEVAKDTKTPKETDVVKVSEEPEGMKLCVQSEATLEQRVARKAFQNLLVFNALVESFAHGANDTANATGPFGAIWHTYREGVYACDGAGTPWYIMSIAGVCVAAGVYFMGYKVIQTMGSELTEIDFHIGYCVEFASGFSVICATFMGMPVSTTHCQVGAVVFIGGFASGVKNVSWKMFGKIAVTWVCTLPFAAGISALMLFLRFAHISY